MTVIKEGLFHQERRLKAKIPPNDINDPGAGKLNFWVVAAHERYHAFSTCEQRGYQPV